MPDKKTDTRANLTGTGSTAGAGGLSLEQYLYRTGYRPVVIPDFDDWLRDYMDTNGDGQIKGGEKTRYNKIVKSSELTAEYQGIYQHAVETLKVEDERLYAQLRDAWLSGVSAQDPEIGKAVEENRLTAAKFGAAVDLAKGSQKNTLIIIAVVAVAALLILKK